MSHTDWEWKLREAVERLRTRYSQIGRKTAAPFLAVIYPIIAESVVLKEWRTLITTLTDEFDVRTIDVLEVTMSVVKELGAERIVAAMAEPMPGSSPEAELGLMWTSAVAKKVREAASLKSNNKPILVLQNLAALYPVSSPRAVMQCLWDSEQSCLNGPVVLLIPGTLVEARVYTFLDCREEFMYRGDIL